MYSLLCTHPAQHLRTADTGFTVDLDDLDDLYDLYDLYDLLLAMIFCYVPWKKKQYLVSCPFFSVQKNGTESKGKAIPR